ncbi:cysteine synthase B [Escherichia coli]|uniref:Cysteine synthase B n=1 Tax=Escherichia coli TaxID=562 RepID=A0A376TVB8_ECOLX|nr:cysteine synthase B [Escherichia coli]
MASAPAAPVAGALRVAKANPGAVVVAIICDRGDRYLSTGVFGEEHFSQGRGFKIIAQAPFYPSAQLGACKKGCAFSSLLPGSSQYTASR